MPLLRRPLPSFSRIVGRSRYKSSNASSAPKLAKPTKYNPPSHPTNLPRQKDPVNYPGPPPVRDPETSQYPHTMPPPGTWTHWFLTSRRLHLYISLSVLTVLAGFASFQNFLRTNPYAHEIYWKWSEPFGSFGSLVTAWRKGVEEQSRRVGEMRRKTVEDVEKRGRYRKAHGLEQTGDEGGFGGWGVKESSGNVAAVAVDTDSPTGGQGSWVDSELKKVEEEAEKAAAAATQIAKPEKLEQAQNEEPKKSSWRFW